MENNIKVGVGLYIFNPQKQLLLGLRKSPHGCGTWCPPGGHMEFGESNTDAAIREAFEETGLQIDPKTVGLIGTTNDFFAETNKHYITLHLQTSVGNAQPKIMEPDKFSAWQWFSLDQLPSNLFLSTANFLHSPVGHKISI